MKRNTIIGTIVALTIFGLVGCGNEGQNSDSQSALTPVSTEASTEASSEVQKTVTNPAEIIVDGFYKEGQNRDDCGTEVKYFYKIPKFDLETAATKKINLSIDEDVKTKIDEELKYMKEGCSITFYKSDYQVFTNGNLVSVLVTIESVNDYTCYYTYTYDVAEDKQVANSDLIKQAGLTEKEFVAEAQKKSIKKCKEIYAGSETDMTPFIENTKQYIDSSVPMYINNEGQLCALVPVASMAGADYYPSLFTF